MIGRELLELADEQDPRHAPRRATVDRQRTTWPGELHTSLELLEASIAEFERVGGGARGFRIRPDPRISTLTTSAFTPIAVGLSRHGRRAHRRCGRAGVVSGPYSLVYALYHGGVPAAVACRAEWSPPGRRSSWTSSRTVISRRARWGRVAGVADALLGRGEEGLRRFDEGLAMQPRHEDAAGVLAGPPRLLRTMCLAAAGRIPEAAALVAEVQGEPADAASHVHALIAGAPRDGDGRPGARGGAALGGRRRRARPMDARMLILLGETRRLALHRVRDVPVSDGSCSGRRTTGCPRVTPPATAWACPSAARGLTPGVLVLRR